MEITTRQAGKILDCSAAWVTVLLHQKRIKGRLLTPRQWLVDEASVYAFKKQRELKKYQRSLLAK